MLRLALFVLLPVGVLAQQDISPYKIRYFANLPTGDSQIYLTNSGASSTIPFPQDGNLCVHAYAFSPAQNMFACCSCSVPPDSLYFWSIRRDFNQSATSPGPGGYTAMTIKLYATSPSSTRLGSQGPDTCNAANPGVPSAGLIAWGTTLQPGVAGSSSSTSTETFFASASLSSAELTKLTSQCGNLQKSTLSTCRPCVLADPR